MEAFRHELLNMYNPVEVQNPSGCVHMTLTTSGSYGRARTNYNTSNGTYKRNIPNINIAAIDATAQAHKAIMLCYTDAMYSVRRVLAGQAVNGGAQATGAQYGTPRVTSVEPNEKKPGSIVIKAEFYYKLY